MADVRTVDIKGVEVVSTGTWNGVPISRRDLEDMVTAWNETRDTLPVTVRLGHDARQGFARALFAATLGTRAADAAAKDAQGWPSFGEPARLYIKGDTLLADLTGVPVALAEWIKAKRYRTRSGGLRFNRTVGGKVYRWMLDHIALLGADTPAVDSLADIGLSDDDADRLVEFSYQATDADPLVTLGDAQAAATTESALDALLAALTKLFDDYSALVHNRTGAPRVRQLFAAFKDDLRRVARADVPLHDHGGQPMNWSLDGVRGVLSLAADASPADVAAALNAADDDTAMRLVNLADGMAFDSPEQLVGWLAGALAVAPGDLGGIAQKVVELMGGDAPEIDPAAAPADPNAPPAAPAGGSNMHDTTTTGVDLAARVVELSERNVDLAARVIALETAAKQSAAEAKVAADAKRLGLSLPAPVRDTLIELCACGNTKAYDAVIANVKSVPTAEKGTSGTDGAVELSDAELRFAKMMGLSPDDVRAHKRAAAAGAA